MPLEGDAPNRGAPKHPSRIDAHIGARLQALRAERNMSRKELGERLGISSVEVLIYELGLTRLDPARIFATARVFDVSVTTFFEALI